MKKELEDRLKVVYATGRLRHHVENTLYDFGYREKIHNALCMYLQKFNITVSKRNVYKERVVFEWVINLSIDPPFEEWKSIKYNNKLKWFDVNKRSYPALWLQFSRVWPAYYWYYNIWSKPKTNNSKIIECLRFPYSKEWLPIHKEIDNAMKLLKIEYLSKEELLEIVPFVLNYMWLDKDNGASCADDEDDEESRPYLDETAVVQCLFQNE